MTTKPSTVARFEKSMSEEKNAESPLEKLSGLNFTNIKSNRLVHVASTESLNLPEPTQVIAEVKEEYKEEYTGFTIYDMGAPSLKLERQIELKGKPIILEIPKILEDEKQDDRHKVIEVFSKARIGDHAIIEPNPYSKVEDVWAGLQLRVRKNKEDKSYVIKSKGLAKWNVQEQLSLILRDVSSGADSTCGYWEVDIAEVVRDEKKGPYIKLTIDEQNTVFLYPIKDTDLKRFQTGNLGSVFGPSTDSILSN